MVHIVKRQQNFFVKGMQWKWVCLKLSGSYDVVTSNRQNIDERKFFLWFYFRKTESPELRRNTHRRIVSETDQVVPGFEERFGWVVIESLRGNCERGKDKRGEPRTRRGDVRREEALSLRMREAFVIARAPVPAAHTATAGTPWLLALCSARVR